MDTPFIHLMLKTNPARIIFFFSWWPKLSVSHKYGARDKGASDLQGNSGLLACNLEQIVLFPGPQFPDSFIHSFNWIILIFYTDASIMVPPIIKQHGQWTTIECSGNAGMWSAHYRTQDSNEGREGETSAPLLRAMAPAPSTSKMPHKEIKGEICCIDGEYFRVEINLELGFKWWTRWG